MPTLRPSITLHGPGRPVVFVAQDIEFFVDDVSGISLEDVLKSEIADLMCYNIYGPYRIDSTRDALRKLIDVERV